MNTKIPRAIANVPAPAEPKNPYTDVAGPNGQVREELVTILCPSCKETNPEKITTRNTPYEILRTCLTCKNQWSGGTMAMASPNYAEPILPQGKILPPEFDIPAVQIYGAPHRMAPYEEDE